MKYGTLLRITDIEKAEDNFKALVAAGFDSCQLVYKPEKYTAEDADVIKALAEKYGVDISAQFCGYYDAETVWDMDYGYLTAGINVEAYRVSRIKYVKDAALFAARIGIEDIIIHAGFVPNNPYAPEYGTMCAAVRTLGKFLKNLGLNLLFETGGEAPIVLVRLIEDVGLDNLYINLDPANILMYGYGNPTDAVTVFGKYVRNFHGKDGCLPTNPRVLGLETPVGEGMVDFPAVLKKLHELGYDRYITIERECGNDRDGDVLKAKAYLENIWNSL